MGFVLLELQWYQRLYILVVAHRHVATSQGCIQPIATAIRFPGVLAHAQRIILGGQLHVPVMCPRLVLLQRKPQQYLTGYISEAYAVVAPLTFCVARQVEIQLAAPARKDLESRHVVATLLAHHQAGQSLAHFIRRARKIELSVLEDQYLCLIYCLLPGIQLLLGVLRAHVRRGHSTQEAHLQAHAHSGPSTSHALQQARVATVSDHGVGDLQVFHTNKHDIISPQINSAQNQNVPGVNYLFTPSTIIAHIAVFVNVGYAYFAVLAIKTPKICYNILMNDQVSREETAEILRQAERCLSVEGDFVELGCYRGDTSVLLGEMLQKKNQAKDCSSSETALFGDEQNWSFGAEMARIANEDALVQSSKRRSQHEFSAENSVNFSPRKVPKLWVYDSFAGLPAKTREDASGAGANFKEGELFVSKREVIDKVRRHGLKNVIIKKAWFDQLTDHDLPAVIAFAFCDGDLYSSIKTSLQLVLPRLERGGTILVHDYNNPELPGSARAVDEFLRSHPEFKLQIRHTLAILTR